MRSKPSLESLLCTYPSFVLLRINYMCSMFFFISHNNSFEFVEQLVDGQVECSLKIQEIMIQFFFQKEGNT